MTAYRVPAVTIVGVVNVAVKKPPEPLEKPGIVAVARSGPVGSGVVPVVARIETVKFGVVPVHALQKRSRSTRVSKPLLGALKV